MFADVNLIKHNHIIGVQDTADVPGKFLINEFLKSNDSDCDIHIFCYDQFCEDLQAELAILDSSSVHFHNCFPIENSTDPLCSFLSSLSISSGNFQRIIIVVDSLSTLILSRGLDYIYRILRRSTVMNENNCRAQIQMLALIHEDTLLDRDQILKNLRHLFRVWIQIDRNSLIVSIRKTSGKVLIRKYTYKLVEDGVKINKANFSSSKCNLNKKDENLPSSTFRLNLNENEKKARDAVHLPYERNEPIENANKGGEIFYEPDEYDDWDEEDPDNDLEFS